MERNRLVILISGTPGTGKTTIAQILKEKYNALAINLTDTALEKGFILEEDPERQTIVADLEKLVPFIEDLIKTHNGTIIIEGHYVDVISDKLISIFVILRTDPHILEPRLKAKGFWPSKIRENIQSEILGTCTSFALETHDRNKIYELDTSTASPEAITARIQYLIENSPDSNVGEINWLQKLEAADKLMEYFQ